MSPVLAVHVGAGVLALVAGAAALVVRKGGRPHRRAGQVFVAAMLAMALAAAALSVTLPDWGNLPGAIFAAYLAATGWAAAAREWRWTAALDRAAPLLGFGAAALSAGFARLAATSPTGLFYGKPAPQFLVFAALALFAAALDLRRLASAGAGSRGRIARHVWRLCTALFFASGSFFLGQQKVMPAWLQGSPVLLALALAPLAAMAVWLPGAGRRRDSVAAAAS